MLQQSATAAALDFDSAVTACGTTVSTTREAA